MIVITGASGRLGRSVTQALAARGRIADVTLGTRDPRKISDNAELGFRTAKVDFDQPECLERAFQGARTVLIICGTTPNEVRIVQHRQAIDAARQAGVVHVVYTSFVNPTRASLFPFAAAHTDTEKYLAAAGGSFTVVRNNHYFDNLKDALQRARRTGQISLPGAHGNVAYLSLVDIGDAMAEILLQENDHRRSYELTGPEALDLFEVAERASAAWGRGISASDMSPERYRKLLEERGLPPYAVEAQIGIRLACGAGEYGRVTRDAPELVGRQMAKLDQYLSSFHPEHA